MYCDGPWEVAFYTLEYPPNRINWCDAETDLFNVMGISFDTEFNRFEMTEYGRKYIYLLYTNLIMFELMI